MIILAAGMPRAGSGWHFNLVHDLVKTAGGSDSRWIREHYRLQSILTEVNCNIGVLSARRLALLLLPVVQGKTFVIKAHASPTSSWRLLSSLGILRTTYISRDPRDAMLSAFEYGKRSLERGRPNAFSHLTDFETSLDFMRRYVQIWAAWHRQKGVHRMRYEDLLMNYLPEARKLAGFLGLDADAPNVIAVIETHQPEMVQGEQGFHFHRGKIGRYRTAYSADEQARLASAFGDVLPTMGYSV